MKYRKKPVVIEAMQYREEMPVDDFCELGELAGNDAMLSQEGGVPHILIQTLEGVMRADIGRLDHQGSQRRSLSMQAGCLCDDV